MDISFSKPTECQSCGSHNFRVVGTVYNGDLNYHDIRVKCLRCGKLNEHITSKKTNI